MEDMQAKGKSPRILLVSGIFPPAVGGPATHVRRIAEHFSSLGWAVTVVTFGSNFSQDLPYTVIRVSRKHGRLIAWARYALVILWESLRHDLIYAFDLTTAGIPSAISARMCNKPFLLRIGGDPIWERAVEKGKRFTSMKNYYEEGLFQDDRPLLHRAICFVVRSASMVITYGEFIRDIYVRYYGVPSERIRIIRNPLPARRASKLETGTVTFIFAGRFVLYKNLARVIRVFSSLRSAYPAARLTLIGEGPEESAIRKLAQECGDAVSFHPPAAQAELFERIASASVALAPALTEFNPNFILESLALGKPSLISRNNGLSIPVPEAWQFDPFDDHSMYAAMAYMLEPSMYEQARKVVATLPEGPRWEVVVAEHESIVRNTLHI